MTNSFIRGMMRQLSILGILLHWPMAVDSTKKTSSLLTGGQNSCRLLITQTTAPQNKDRIILLELFTQKV